MAGPSASIKKFRGIKKKQNLIKKYEEKEKSEDEIYLYKRKKGVN